MAFYTICGKPDCLHFAHAIYVAQYLYEHLPNFRYRKVEKSKEEWPAYVAELNKKHGWYMVKSPIIWKEISTWGGKPYLLGNLSQFWEYCYEYYGLLSSISKESLQSLARDNLAFFEEDRYQREHQKYSTNITIMGADQIDLILSLLDHVFIKVPYFLSGNGFYVKIYAARKEKRKKCSNGLTLKNNLEDIVEYYNSSATFGDNPIIEIVDSEENAIKNADLLLFLEDFTQTEAEDTQEWKNRSINRVMELAEAINAHATRHLRIILCNEGPSSLMASGMVQFFTLLVPSNIVVLAAHKGLSAIGIISEISGVPIAEIGAPPIWGLIGMNEYVDEANIVFEGHIFKPYKRALTASEGSTLPLGTVVTELRTISYLIPKKHDVISKRVEERNANIKEKLHRPPILAKLRALQSLLRIWYSEEASDEIVSLGVCSSGSYGIPPGIVFCQPCIQDIKRRWKPFPNFPLVDDVVHAKVKEIINESIKIVASVGLGITFGTDFSDDSFSTLGSSDIDLDDDEQTEKSEQQSELTEQTQQTEPKSQASMLPL